MKKRIYRADSVKLVDGTAWASCVEGKRLSVNVDVAKAEQYALVMVDDDPLGLVRWNQLKEEENRTAMSLFKRLADSASSADFVLEPSGTYGDPLRYRARDLGFSIHRVSPKRSHDYAEVLDGVPSRHDGKSAWILGRLHAEGVSEPWDEEDETSRNLKALVREVDIYQDQKVRTLGRLESWAARHWPELHQLMPLGRVTVLKLLARYGSAEKVAAQSSEAGHLMKKVGGAGLKASKIESILLSASRTAGIPPTKAEAELGQALAREILRNREALADVEKRISSEARQESCIAGLIKPLGLLTAVVLFVEVGDPRKFPSVRAYLKAAGLNLRENSSGRHQGRLSLSKRGSSRARRWLYLAVLRWIQHDPVAKAWYARKVQRDGGRVKQKALVAMMRKLMSGLWHVARGDELDSRKLFDTRRLGPVRS